MTTLLTTDRVALIDSDLDTAIGAEVVHGGASGVGVLALVAAGDRGRRSAGHLVGEVSGTSVVDGSSWCGSIAYMWRRFRVVWS